MSKPQILRKLAEFKKEFLGRVVVNSFDGHTAIMAQRDKAAEEIEKLILAISNPE